MDYKKNGKKSQYTIYNIYKIYIIYSILNYLYNCNLDYTKQHFFMSLCHYVIKKYRIIHLFTKIFRTFVVLLRGRKTEGAIQG